MSARQADYADADGHRKVGDYRKGVDDIEKGRAQEEAGEGKRGPDSRKQTGKRKADSANAGEHETGEASGEDTEVEAEQ